MSKIKLELTKEEGEHLVKALNFYQEYWEMRDDPPEKWKMNDQLCERLWTDIKALDK